MSLQASKQILAYLADQKQNMIHFLYQLVVRESPSTVPERQQWVFEVIGEQLRLLDYEILSFPGKKTGGFLLARPRIREKGAPIQLMIGHVDTVWPEGTLMQMPFREEQNRILGPGVYDMKAGITQIVFALRALRDLEHPLQVTPVVLINSDEEIGSRESSKAIRRLARIANRAFILEPPLGLEGKLKTARKGIGRFHITVKGKPAHAGLDPEKGASAIVELSHQIQRLFALNDPQKGISVNVGMIQGGISANVVAPESSAVVDVRVLSEKDATYITEKILTLQPHNPETRLTIEGGMGRPPMEPTPRNRRLWALAKDVGKALHIDLQEGVAGGGSDGNTTSQYTATLDGLGTVGDGAHAAHEFIFSEKLPERTALLALLLLAEPLKEPVSS